MGVTRRPSVLEEGQQTGRPPAYAVSLTRFLEYPELELSTNLAENSMRTVALGRKKVAHQV